jgi:hypothetical protein
MVDFNHVGCRLQCARVPLASFLSPMMYFVLAHLSAALKHTLHKYNSFSSVMGQCNVGVCDIITAHCKTIV